MQKQTQIKETLSSSPSVELLTTRNRESIIPFFVNVFFDKEGAILSEQLNTLLADYLEQQHIEKDEDSEISVFDSYETKAKKYIQHWCNKGFLTNFRDDTGDIFYELSSYSEKTIEWLLSLKKEEYIGTESKFKTIFSQLKELVEYTNENKEKRIKILQDRKREIEQQLERIEAGEEIKVFEEFEIVPRFNQLTQAAKELLSDFKVVEDNFKEITKKIYQQHADTSLSKGDILEFTFNALDELKESQQGKSFYAFWSFLLSQSLQEEWNNLIKELYQALQKKEINIQDNFLKGMKTHLYYSGQRVYKANDRMAEKLTRIIGEKENTNSHLSKSIIQDIKKILISINKNKKRPTLSLELETEPTIYIPFDRKLTLQKVEETTYTDKPLEADNDFTDANGLEHLFAKNHIDKNKLRHNIQQTLKNSPQTTLSEIIQQAGGIEQGLAEVIAYIQVIKEYRHTINKTKTEHIIFNPENGKTVQIPEIILNNE